MKKFLALLWLALSIGGAQAQSIGPAPSSGGLTAGTTPVTGCTSLQLFYNNAGAFNCIVGSSWSAATNTLTLAGAGGATHKLLLSTNAGGAQIDLVGGDFGQLTYSGLTTEFYITNLGAGPLVFRTSSTEGARLTPTQHFEASKSVKTACTTVAGLGAAGTAGRNWCVNDQLTACPVLGGTFTGGGAVVCKAFDDGTNWTHQ